MNPARTGLTWWRGGPARTAGAWTEMTGGGWHGHGWNTGSEPAPGPGSAAVPPAVRRLRPAHRGSRGRGAGGYALLRRAQPRRHRPADQRRVSGGPRPCSPRPAPPGRHEPMTSQPAPEDAARLASFLRRHPCWSAFWDKRSGVWRVAEDDPGSVLYAESPDLDTVIRYITAHP